MTTGIMIMLLMFQLYLLTPPSQQSLRSTVCEGDICECYGWERREKQGRVYDFFMTSNEYEWWEIRLNTLYPEVDGFLILESNITHSGVSKPLYFNESIGNFSQFQNKIQHVILDTDVPSWTSWEREPFHRESLFTIGFKRFDLEENDVILVSDADEIPKPQIIRALKTCLPGKISTLQTYLRKYSFEYNEGVWNHPQAMLYNKGSNPTAEQVRYENLGQIIPDSAWSCSYCFSSFARFQYKLESFLHQELNNQRNKDPKNILKHISRGTRFYNSPISYQYIANPDMPDYLKGNQKYRYMYDRHNPTGGFSREELNKYGLL